MTSSQVAQSCFTTATKAGEAVASLPLVSMWGMATWFMARIIARRGLRARMPHRMHHWNGQGHGSRPNPTMIIATAGHVDHGKTSLVRALTGVDTDRLPEEKARGLTIDIGFALCAAAGRQAVGLRRCAGPSALRPQHAGRASAMWTMPLIVVAADDGVMPQTVEHVEILGLLGVAVGDGGDHQDGPRSGGALRRGGGTNPRAAGRGRHRGVAV